MLKASNLTEKDIGFFIQFPADSGITDELLENLTTAKHDESIHIFISDWLVYERNGEEEGICWQIPGIKLYFKDFEPDFDKAKSIANQLLAELNNKTQLSLQLVYIDKLRLTSYNPQK
jgi:hypothetical protein